jgi:two-component system sensor histidine kinase BarA
MRNWNIQRRVLVIALLPAALIALMLTVYHARTRIDEVESSTIDHGEGLARHLAPLSEFGVISGNRALLRSIARSAVAEDHTVARVTIRDESGNTLADARDHAANAGPQREGPLVADGESLIRVSRPIRRTIMSGLESPLDGYGGQAGFGQGNPIGRIEILVDLRPVRREERAVLLESLGISALALLITGALALRIGQGVTGPVRRLTRTVEQIRGGDLGARPPRTSGGELGSLERGIAEMAEEIEQTQASLQHRVERATADLQETLDELAERNAELEEARREAEAASEFKSRFLANISHEIRTPMNSILGFTELLARADLDPVEADYLETIHDSARSLLDLLNGILDLSKVESGRMELEPADTDLNEILVDVFQLLGPHAHEKGVEFIVERVPQQCSRVRTDPIRLKQVLINLASNAVKFTEQGHVRLAAWASAPVDDRLDVIFSVEDTGAGIPESAQTHLFQAFAQGRTSGDQDGYLTAAGTGLGLHIASEIVFLMDGAIEFRSEPGGGSQFWFQLCLEALGPPDTDGRDEGGPGPVPVLTFVDPDADTRAASVRDLEAAGYSVRSCSNAAQVHLQGDEHAIIVHVPARATRAGTIPGAPGLLRGLGLPLLAQAHAHGPEARNRLVEAGYEYIVPKTPDIRALRRALDPIVRAGAQPEAARAATGQEPIDAVPRPAAEHVLVVDDHPVNRKLFESYLREAEIEVTATGSSDEALEWVAAERFDAILLDLHLPHRDGLETARRIRMGPGPNTATPMIAVTADAFEDAARPIAESGVSELLVKPVSCEQLLERLAKLCGHREVRRTASSGGAPAPAADTAEADLPNHDTRTALQRAAGRQEVADELFAVLVRSLPESRDALLRAWRAGDREALRSAAHRLRGAAAYCGVPRLEAAVAALERAAREAAEAELTQRIEALEKAIAALLMHHDEEEDDAAG